MKAGRYPALPLLLVDSVWSSLISTESLLAAQGINNFARCLDADAVLDELERRRCSAVVLDLGVSQVAGERLLGAIGREFPQLPVIAVAGVDDVDQAVRCIKLGAFDYVAQPVEPARLTKALEHALALSDLRDENRALRDRVLSPAITDLAAFAPILTNNDRMFSIFRYAESIAGSPRPLLITGEPGVGKELLARAIHRLSECGGAFVALEFDQIGQPAITETLFGRERSASGGRGRHGLIERAQDGFLYLDGLAELSEDTQDRLLRLLQDGNFQAVGATRLRRSDARVITSSSGDLWALCKAGRLRKDLNFRLRAHHIDIPPLRQRPSDVPLLLEDFVQQTAAELTLPSPVIPDRAIELLLAYRFPGNVTELRKMAIAAVHATTGPTLDTTALQRHIEAARAQPLNALDGEAGGAPVMFPAQLPKMKETADLLLKEALRRSNGNQSLAGRMLGISQQAVSKRLKNMG